MSNFDGTSPGSEVHLDNFCVAVNEGSCAEALANANVPEPGTFALLGGALILLGRRFWRC